MNGRLIDELKNSHVTKSATTMAAMVNPILEGMILDNE